VVWQIASLPHHWHTPCGFCSVQTLRHWLQCPVTAITITYPLLSLFALKVGKRSRLRLYPYSIVKVLLMFQLYHPTKGTIVELKNEPIFS
jgi:hypothetical protein